MPILDVELVGATGDVPSRDLATRLADAAGTVFGTDPGRTWVRVRLLPTHQYAENGAPNEVEPVFVEVLQAEAANADERARWAQELCHAVAAECDRPHENVHILFLPPGKGRVAFGGKLLR